jgi:hypothetical protein
MRTVCVAAVATILLGCSTQPSQPPATTPVAQAQAQAQSRSGDPATATPKTVRKDGTDVICRREAVPNSRLGGNKVCLTREEWEQRETLAADALREQQKPPTAPEGD